MKISLIITVVLVSLISFADHLPFPGKTIPGPQFYRDMTMKIRTSAEFEIPQPGVKSTVQYSLSWDTPAYKLPIFNDMHLTEGDPHFFRDF